MRSRGLSSLALLLITLPLPAQDQKAALLATDRAAAQLSSDSGFAAAVLGNADDQAVLLWPGAPVAAGGEEVGKLLAALPSRDSLRLVWQPIGLELAPDSTLGVTWGIAVSAPRSAQAPPRIGRYTTAWRRDGGRWTIAAMLVNGAGRLAPTAGPGDLPRTKPPARPTAGAAAFVAADLAFARLARDSGAAVAFRRWAAPEAFTLGSGGLLTRGPTAIGSAVDGPAAWRWHPVASGASHNGELGWTVGESVIVPQGAEPEYGKYLTVWIRPGGGVPRFLTDGGNDRPPTP